MGDLVAFLRARLDEDAVRATMREVHTRECESLPDAAGYTYPCDCGVPERMMREVEAKRKILALHHLHDEDSLTQYSLRLCATCCESCAYENPLEDWPCPTILAVAAVYGDHPDYDPAWRVT